MEGKEQALQVEEKQMARAGFFSLDLDLKCDTIRLPMYQDSDHMS